MYSLKDTRTKSKLMGQRILKILFKKSACDYLEHSLEQKPSTMAAAEVNLEEVDGATLCLIM